MLASAALGDFARHTVTKLLPYSHYMLALWRFENEAKLNRGGIAWDFSTEGIHTPREGGIFNLWAKTRCRFAADAARSRCVHNR